MAALIDTVSMISVTPTNKNPQLKPKAETTSSLWYYSPHDMHVSTDDHSIRKHSTFCKPCQCISDWAAHTSPRRWPATGGWFPRNNYKLCGLWGVGRGSWVVGRGLWVVGVVGVIQISQGKCGLPPRPTNGLPGNGCGLWGRGLWVVGYGLWVVGCGLWVVGCGLWGSWGRGGNSDIQFIQFVL